MSEIEIGGRIDGKYEVLGRIGGGGMGQVYRVRHIHLEEHRVIKVMHPDLARSAEAIDRFGNEARLATKIKHPNVATLHDFSRLPDGSFYMVWEHIEGQDVEGWLQRRGRFPLPIALELAIQVLSGLEVIHEEGIVHRDVSPDNLMITSDARGRLGVKIIDLGLADQVSPMGERSGQVGGKMNYCSPEHLGLIEGAQPDHTSDLYSFAIVLYRMLTGVLPFPKAMTAADVALRETVPPRALSLETVHALMQKALAYHRADRFQLASEFRSELLRLGEEIDEQQETARSLEGLDRLKDAAAALRENRFADAESSLHDLETRYPGIEGLEDLRSRLDEMTRARRQVQLMQVREMVEQYLASKQKALARLSLESLLEIDPNYRDKDVLETRIDALERAQEHEAKVQHLLKEGRQKLASGDYVTARALQTQLENLDEHAAAELDRMLRDSDQQDEETGQVDAISVRLDELLERSEFDRAAQEIAKLESLGVAKVTRDLFERRLEHGIAAARQAAEVHEILRLYPEAVMALKWAEARDLVARLVSIDPDNSRLTELLQEVDHGDQQSRQREAISEGVSTLTTLLDAGRLEEARMALSVLLRVNGGDHPLSGHFEQRLLELERNRS